MIADWPLRWSWQALKRDWQAGELRLIAGALIIAVSATTTVGFFTDRINRALAGQASELIGGDLVLTSRDEIGAGYRNAAEESGLVHADTLAFRSAASTDIALEMTELKAVASPYPLRGELRVSDQLFGEEYVTTDLPGRGEAWLDTRLMQQLGIETGDVVNIGALTFTVTQVLTYEPDRGGDLFNIAPRAMIHMDDIPATQLLQPGSRVTWRLLLAGDLTAKEDFRRWLANTDSDDIRVEDIREGRPELRTALERAEQFLSLAATVSVALAGLAVALAARRYTIRHLDYCAILRCLGASQRFVFSTFTLQLVWLGLIAGGIGVGIGWLAQHGLALLLAGLIAGEVPGASPVPAVTGLAIGLITLLGFALPQIQQLRNVPPGRVLRRDLGPIPASQISVYAIAIAALAALLVWQSGDIKLSSFTLLGLLGAGAILAVSAWLLIHLLSHLRTRVGVAWRFGLANIARRAAGSTAQVVGIGLGLTLMLILTVVRSDLIAGWQERIPDDAPNYFLINIQPDEAAGVAAFLRTGAGIDTKLVPMVRGRVTAINGEPVNLEDYPDGRPRRLISREFNLSWANTLQEDNRIVAGRWWTDEDEQPLWSVEEEIAGIMGVGVGDELTYSVADQEVTATIHNLRWVEWDSFNVNFFVVANPGVLDNYPATYITSFYLPAKQRGALNQLARQFPSATVIDVDTLLIQVRRIMDQVVLTIGYVFGFTLLAGIIVLLAALQSTHDERRYETALLTALGAKRAQILRGLAAEFTTIGIVAGVLAGIAASLTGWLLSEYVFQIPYAIDWRIWVYGLVAGIGVVLIAGLAGTWKVMRHSPLEVLR
ncbi:MAG: FtsX-like permease family protein [Pseudomonadales bacterium]